MRNLTIALALTATMGLAGTFVSKGEAAAWTGAGSLAAMPQSSAPIEPAACRGAGPYCPPGSRRVCGPYGRCWCAPC